VLGGYLRGSPLVDGAVASAGATVTVDGTVLQGIVAVGDVFVVDGDAINRTVTGTAVRIASTNHVSGITFTPAATVGFATNVTVTFASNSVAELRSWSLDEASLEMVDVTRKGHTHRQHKGAIGTWSGSASAYLDYGDTVQAELIDKLASGTPTLTSGTLGFVIEGTAAVPSKMLYGSVILSNFAISSPEGSAVVEVTFNFQGTDALATDWNV